jgi:hypothetical protein
MISDKAYQASARGLRGCLRNMSVARRLDNVLVTTRLLFIALSAQGLHQSCHGGSSLAAPKKGVALVRFLSMVQSFSSLAWVGRREKEQVIEKLIYFFIGTASAWACIEIASR